MTKLKPSHLWAVVFNCLVKFIWRTKRLIKRAYVWVRFGKITERVTGTAGHMVVSEIEYLDRSGKVVGFWCCGYYDPSLPYKG